MPLFEGETITNVVTPEDVRNLTGIRATDFQFPNASDPEAELDTLIEKWIEGIGSHVRTRIGRAVTTSDEDYEAIQDIVIRTVAKIVGLAQQQRTSPIIQVNDFAVQVLNTSDVTKDLNKELKPYMKRSVSIFHSLDDYDDSTTS